MKVLAILLAVIAVAYCAPQFVGQHHPGMYPQQGFGTSGSAANAGAQTFTQGGGFGGFPHTSGSAATAGSQSFTQGGFGGGVSGSSANAASQTFSQGGFHG